MRKQTNAIRPTRPAVMVMSCILGMSGTFAWAEQSAARSPEKGSGQIASASDCGAEVRGSAELLKPGALIVFGELHGTKEAPALVGNLACRAARAGRAVRVGLEMPNSLQPSVDTFLSSDGNRQDIEQLTQGFFWSMEEGRSSKAMLDLLDMMRRMKKSNLDADVFLFDGLFASPAGRDAGMAKNILSAVAKSPGAVHLVLAGNMHARTDDERWMSWHLLQEHEQLVCLNIAYRGGSAWVSTTEGTGPVTLGGRDRGEQPFIERFDEPDDRGYHGLFYLVEVTASPPVHKTDQANDAGE